MFRAERSAGHRVPIESPTPGHRGAVFPSGVGVRGRGRARAWVHVKTCATCMRWPILAFPLRMQVDLTAAFLLTCFLGIAIGFGAAVATAAVVMVRAASRLPSVEPEAAGGLLASSQSQGTGAPSSPVSPGPGEADLRSPCHHQRTPSLLPSVKRRCALCEALRAALGLKSKDLAGKR